jgi:ADP-dependent NAD(P)H-hydrate dehydratase / NAD(P)H-hydrate epimerase
VDWLEPLPDAARMRAWDTWAIEQQGIASLELMERAGLGLARVVEDVAPHGTVAVVCGRGNNGGDGYVAARHLRDAGREVAVLAMPGDPAPDAAEMARRLPGRGAVGFDPAHLEGAAVVVDALLGTGFEGAPREPVAGAIAAMGGHRVVAADVPSGVNASTGEVEGAAVRAVATASFHAGKLGLWVHPGKAHAGEVRVIDIGIPAGAPGTAGAGLIGPAVLDDIPRRDADSTKFSSGNVVVVGGSPGLTGAPVLAALGAMRAGAGYVTVTGPVEPAQRPVEAMYSPDPEAVLGRADAVVLGPGLGKSDEAFALVRELAARIEAPLVIDADGLNALAGRLTQHLAGRRAPTILTPHGGELARLLEVGSDGVRAHRLRHARKAAEAAGAIVVLKGDDTLVVSPGGHVAVSPGRAPGLATAGTGDVLAGVIAAMLARSRTHPVVAACAGVYAHLRAGRIAAEPHGAEGVIATDVAAALPRALAGR